MADSPEFESQEFPLEPPKQDWPRARGKECVLIAEDSEALRDLMLAMLSGLGYEVLTASGGHEAIRQIERHHGVDLVITDAIMPKGGGFQIMDEMRERWPHTPILITSGFTEEIEAGLLERTAGMAPAREGVSAAGTEGQSEPPEAERAEAEAEPEPEDDTPPPVIEFLPKPFSPEKLAHLVRDILDRVRSDAPPRRLG
ncbi:MAG: response regulator [Candidatus Eiseniibacteriota bacterium]